MADDEIQTSTSAIVETVTPPVTKKATRGKRVAEAKNPVKLKTRGLSVQEKLDKIAQIEAQVASGATLKDAVASVGISDQTYYQWKKNIGQPSSQARPAVVTTDDEFAEFIQLEEENRQLRKQLSEKLRAENADLRKRLGLK